MRRFFLVFYLLSIDSCSYICSLLHKLKKYNLLVAHLTCIQLLNEYPMNAGWGARSVLGFLCCVLTAAFRVVR